MFLWTPQDFTCDAAQEAAQLQRLCNRSEQPGDGVEVKDNIPEMDFMVQCSEQQSLITADIYDTDSRIT